MLQISNQIMVVEDHGKSRDQLESLPRVEIRNHWNDDRLVVVKILDQEVTVIANELFAALKNATNTGRY